MTLTEFNQLKMNQKSDMVWEWGYYLGARKYGNDNLVVFGMNNFFVEMRINVHTNKTEGIVALSAEDLSCELLGSISIHHPFMKKERMCEFDLMERAA